MCEDCGCAVTQIKDKVTVDVLHRLNEANDHQAAHNRDHFKNHNVLVINIMSSPGSGKTRLLESLIKKLKDEVRVAVIEGDLETENDAERIRNQGVEAIQINTSTACHLDANQIHHALHHLPLDELDIVFIENVGNLVCPAGFDLGQSKNVVLLACTEGDDKPSKYPVMFRTADIVLISKSDLLPVLDDFDVERAITNIRKLASTAPCINVSGKSEEGLATFVEYIRVWRKEQALA